MALCKIMLFAEKKSGTNNFLNVFYVPSRKGKQIDWN